MSGDLKERLRSAGPGGWNAEALARIEALEGGLADTTTRYSWAAARADALAEQVTSARIRIEELEAEIERLRAIEASLPKTLGGLINNIYGDFDPEDCAIVDREWMKIRGIALAQSVPQPIEDALPGDTILAYFGPTHAGWYRCHLNDDAFASRGPKPFWEPAESRYLGILWARKNQPTVWLPLPEPPSLSSTQRKEDQP